MPSAKTIYWAALCLAAMILLILMRSTTVQAYQATSSDQPANHPLIQSVQGRDLFSNYCASCHGPKGTGNGPMAPALKKRVPDLTQIAQRNGGVFPEARIRSIIAGDSGPTSHGSREMPVWGPVFHQVEQDQDWGDVRLDNLMRYLKSIQVETTRKK